MNLAPGPEKLNLGHLGPKGISSEVHKLSSKFKKQDLIFLKNHTMNAIKLSNLKKILGLGVWGLKTTSGPAWLKTDV